MHSTTSAEHARKLRNVVRVAAAYFGMLGRVPKGGEHAGGVALLAGRAPLSALLGQVFGSAAYRTRIAGLCSPSYRDFRLPPPPPQLSRSLGPLVGRTNFRVVRTDPHDLDGDGDGTRPSTRATWSRAGRRSSRPSASPPTSGRACPATT